MWTFCWDVTIEEEEVVNFIIRGQYQGHYTNPHIKERSSFDLHYQYRSHFLEVKNTQRVLSVFK